MYSRFYGTNRRLNSSNVGQDRRQSPYRPQVSWHFDLMYQVERCTYAYSVRTLTVGDKLDQSGLEENSNLAIQVW